MSFQVGAILRNSVNLRALVPEYVVWYTQQALDEARLAGLAYLEEHTPKGATLRLSSSIEVGENQSAVWFRIAGIIDGRPYGYAQEFGWHDRGGGWHEGHHMLRDAGEVAAATFVEFSSVPTQRSGMGIQAFTAPSGGGTGVEQGLIGGTLFGARKIRGG